MALSGTILLIRIELIGFELEKFNSFDEKLFLSFLGTFELSR
jgi:hypothetical protein